MKKIYIVMEAYHDDSLPVQAFENVDEASLFCREKNLTCGTFYIQELKLKEKEN